MRPISDVPSDGSDTSAVPSPHAPYTAALIVGELENGDIVNLVARGFVVRPFRQVDDALTALIMGNTAERPQPAHRSPVEIHDSGKDDQALRRDRTRVGAPRNTYTDDFAAQISAALAPVIPGGISRQYFQFCMRRTGRRVQAAEAAQAIGVDREELESMLQQAGCPQAEVIARWFRILHAAWLLSHTPKRSVKAVAQSLSFPSGAVLATTMRRYTGMSPSEIPDRGGYPILVAQFRTLLKRPSADGAANALATTSPLGATDGNAARSA